MFTQLMDGSDLMIPRILFRSRRYKNMSSSAKLVYSFLLQSLRFCKRNNWIDSNGDLYLLLPMDVIGQSIGLTRPVVKRAVKVLCDNDLIYTQRQGSCLPNRIYVHEPVIRQEEMDSDISQELLYG